MYECTPRARLPAVRLGLVGGRAARHGGPAYSSAARRQALARCGRVTVENSQYHLLRGAVDTVSLRCVGACGVWRELTLRCDNVTRAWALRLHCGRRLRHSMDYACTSYTPLSHLRGVLLLEWEHRDRDRHRMSTQHSQVLTYSHRPYMEHAHAHVQALEITKMYRRSSSISVWPGKCCATFFQSRACRFAKCTSSASTAGVHSLRFAVEKGSIGASRFTERRPSPSP